MVAALMLAALASSLITSPARALAPPSPWDGTNPFSCVVQDAGFGPTGPYLATWMDPPSPPSSTAGSPSSPGPTSAVRFAPPTS